MGHPLDPIGTLFSTLMETGRGGEDGHAVLLDFSGTHSDSLLTTTQRQVCTDEESQDVSMDDTLMS